jgi:hypothetical protein
VRIVAWTVYLCLGGLPALLSAAEDPLELAQKFRLQGDYDQAESVLRDALKTAGIRLRRLRS